MRYIVTNVSDLEAAGIDTSPLRKSVDGDLAVIHETFYDEHVSDSGNVQRYGPSSVAFRQLIERAFYRDRNDKLTRDKLLYKYYLSDELTDEQKANYVNHVQPWEPGIMLDEFELVRYDGKVYRIIIPHMTQSDWIPDQVPNLFLFVPQTQTDDGTPVIPDWIQPIGAHDAYNEGDKVLFEGVAYVSLINDNVWSPAAYPQGWEIL